MMKKFAHLYHREVMVDGVWVYLGPVQCRCHIGEDHWTERPELAVAS